MPGDSFFFYAFSALALLGGLGTVLLRNAVHCALALMTSLLGVAGLYLLQGAEFLFAVQIVLYIGGIMVLFLFVIMLVNLDQASKLQQFGRQTPIALVVALAAAAAIFSMLSKSAVLLPAPVSLTPLTGGNTETVANVLFTDYLLPFELVSILLLVAVVGSVMMAGKRTE